jgi:hypothetical protein
MGRSLDGVPHSYRDSLDSEISEQETVQTTGSDDRRLLCDFILRSDRLAKDERFAYLASRRRRDDDCAYQSPHAMKMHLSYMKTDLMTMDVNTIYNRPTKSDVVFFNEPTYRSYRSVWEKKRPHYYDSIARYDSTLQSVTNDSIKREGLAECDSLDRKISFDVYS